MITPVIEKPTEDTLFLACTRPTMIYGVTVEAFVLIMVGATFLYLAAGSLLYLFSGVFFYFICRVICKYDPNQFRILAAWASTKLSCQNRTYWGASSVSPLRTKKAKNWRQLKKLGE